MYWPWQAAQWQQLQQQKAHDNLPHALLLSGQPGLGLSHFAHVLAQSLICQSPKENGTACGVCRHCCQFTSGAYPDFCFVGVDEEKSQITVDQIRELIHFSALSNSADSPKVAIISPAERMNTHAANSLLKTLEEPPGHMLILLVSEQLGQLPATIRSRCQLLRFTRPSEAIATQWLDSEQVEQGAALLRLAQGAPCLAKSLGETAELTAYQSLVESVIQLLQGQKTIAQLRPGWALIEPLDVVLWSQSLVRDCIRAACGASQQHFENSQYETSILKLVRGLDLQALFFLYDSLLHAGSEIDHPLNTELRLDEVLLAWNRLATGGK